MSYSDTDASRYDSAPVELFQLVSDDGNEFAYTTGALAVTHNGVTYLPLAGMTRSSIQSSAHTEDQGEVEIEFPASAQIVALYALADTIPNISINIIRLQRQTLEYAQIFSGEVTEILIGDDAVTFKCESIFSRLLGSEVPSIVVQSPCNHCLYDEKCKVNRALHSVETDIRFVDKRTLQVGSIGGYPDDFFVGGEIVITSTGERRTIVSHAGFAMEVNFEFRDIGVGMLVTVSAGCDMSYSSPKGCVKFNNQLNFGGFPFVPGESNNVFSKGL